MATFEDAAAGWGIFRGRDGRVSRSQLNAALAAMGRVAISERTYSHYRKLQRLGYTEYVSINRLDIRHANDSVFDLADRSRYVDRPLQSPGRLVIPRGADTLTIRGVVGRVSEGFATLRVRNSEEVQSAARSTKYDKAVLVFDEVGLERAVQITEAVPRDNDLDLLLEFRSLLDQNAVFGSGPYPQNISRLVVNLGPDASLATVLSATHTAFDLFESVRGVVDLVATSAVVSAPPSPTPRVRRLEFNNPLELVIAGASAVFIGVTFVLMRATDLASKMQSVVHAGKSEKREQELHPLRVQALQLDNLKKAVELAPLLAQVSPAVAEALGIEIPSPNASIVPRLEALKDQAIEAAVELQSITADPIEISGETDSRTGTA